MEKNFDNRALLRGLYDFSQGIPCGASHISAAKVCRVGVPGGTEYTARLSEKEAAVLNQYGESMKKMWEDTNLEEAAVMAGQMNEIVDDMTSKLKNGDLTYEELEHWAINGSEGGNWMQASMILVGMEPGAGGFDSKNVDVAKVLGEDIALGTLYADVGATNSPRAAQAIKFIAQEGDKGWWKSAVSGEQSAWRDKVPPVYFAKRVAEMDAIKSASQYSNPISTYMSSKMTVLDQSIIRGVSLSDRRMYDVLAQQKDPKVAAIGRGGRDAFKNAFNETRSRAILTKINQAAADGPNFKGAMAMPGGLSKGAAVKPDKNWRAYERMAVEHQRAGGKVFLTNYKFTGKNGDEYTTPIMTFQMANNKSFVVPMVSANSGAATSDVLSGMFNAGRASVGPGKPEWTAPLRERGKDGQPKGKELTISKLMNERPAPAPRPTRTTGSTNRAASQQRSTQRVQQQKSQAEIRTQQKLAMMTQVQTLRAEGRSDAAIRERLKPIYGSLISSI